MKKMLVWFHSFPEASEAIDDQQWFEQVRISAFQKASEKQPAQKLFAGNFHEFSDFITGQTDIADIEIVLPAKEVLYTQISVPSKSRKRIMQAIPFILEDNLIQDIDNQFFALGDIIDGQCNIAIVHRPIIKKIFNQFKKLSLCVSTMSSELFLLPWYSHQWSITFLQDKVLIRTGAQSSVTVTSSNAEFMFQLLLTKDETQESRNPESLVIYSQPEEQQLTKKIQLLAQDYAIETRVETGDLLNFALSENRTTKKGRAVSDNKGINLFQGEFHPGNMKTVKIPFVKPLSVMVIIAILSQVAFMVYQMQYYKNQLDKSKTELELLFFKTFPDTKRLRDVRLQAENKLRQLQKNSSANDSFLNLLGIVGQELQLINNLKIHNIRYVDGILQVDIRSKDFVFNKLESAIQDKHGLLVEEKSSSKMKNEVQTVVNFKLRNR